LLLAALYGCTGAGEAPVVHEAQKEPVAILTRQEVLGKLPCFDCHLLEEFTGKPQPGVFSHELHSGFDVHCNQCHLVAGHRPPMVHMEVCNTCHSLEKFTYRGGGMGKVVFNHEFHATAFGCGECHPKPFLMKRGSAKMTMEAMYSGGLCGKCHDGKMAFAATDCTKCHKG
jgi:c(7)-type cytochrome triheme protein